MIHYRVPKDVRVKEKNRVHIIPIGDCQSESQLYRLVDLIKWASDQWDGGNQVYFILLGDYFECTSPSERVKLAGADLHKPTYETLNTAYIRLADDMVGILKPMKGNVWTIQTGHHTTMLMLKKGANLIRSDQYIAEKLDAEYAGDGVATIYVNINGLPFKIMAMHGYGSASTEGGQANKRVKMRQTILDAHVYCMGHDNSKIVIEKEPMILTPEGPRAYKQYFVGIGSLQESYPLGELEASYAERLGMPPSALGFVRITVKTEVYEKKLRLDYHIRS